MISSINPTLSTALSLWQSMPAAETATQSKTSSPSATNAVNPSATAQTSIQQIFAILAAAKQQNGGAASAQSVMSAYASETYSTATASVNVATSTTIATPDVLSQINSAVRQVNALMKQTPNYTDGAQVKDSDAVAVTTGSAPISYQIGISLGGATPFDLGNAFYDLTYSSNAGVAAAAKDILSRQIQIPEDLTVFEWMSNDRDSDPLGSVGGTVAWSLTELRDQMVLGLAESLMDGSATATSFAAGVLSATYNGSFTLINMHGSMDLENNSDPDAQGGANVGGAFGGDSNASWAIVLPTDTVTTTVSVTETAKSTAQA